MEKYRRGKSGKGSAPALAFRRLDHETPSPTLLFAQQLLQPLMSWRNSAYATTVAGYAQSMLRFT